MNLADAIKQAESIVETSKRVCASPVSMEVAKNSNGELVVQPFGMHKLFKSHKLIHVVPI